MLLTGIVVGFMCCCPGAAGVCRGLSIQADADPRLSAGAKPRPPQAGGQQPCWAPLVNRGGASGKQRWHRWTKAWEAKGKLHGGSNPSVGGSAVALPSARLRCRPTAVLASSRALPPSSGQTISEEGGVEDEAGVAAHVMHKNLAALKARASLRQRWAFSAHAQRSGVGRIDSLAKRPENSLAESPPTQVIRHVRIHVCLSTPSRLELKIMTCAGSSVASLAFQGQRAFARDSWYYLMRHPLPCGVVTSRNSCRPTISQESLFDQSLFFRGRAGLQAHFSRRNAPLG